MSSLPADVAKRVSDYLHQALSACDRRDWSAATLMFTMLLKVDPGNGEALLHRANVHLQGAKTAKALADVEACLALPNAAIYAVHATYLQAHIMLLQGRAGQTLAIVDQFLRTADPAAYPQLVDFRPRMEALRMEALQFVEARRQAFAAKEEDDVEFFMHYDDMSKFELLKEHFLSSGELPCAQCHAMYQCEAQAFRLASAPLCALCSDGGATATNVQAAAPPVASAAPLAQQPTPMAHITQQVQAMAIRPASAVQMGAPMNGHVFPSAVDRGQYNPPGFGAFAAATQAFAASPFALHGQHQAPQASGGSVSEPADPFHRLIQHQQQYQPPPQQQQPPASGGSASAPADPFHRLIEHQQQQYQPPPQQQQPPHQSHGPSPPSSIANASAPVDFDAAAVDFSVAPADFEPYDDLERMIAGEVDSFDPDGGVYFEQHKDDEGDAGQEFQHQPQDEPDEPTRHSEEGQPPARAPSSTPAAVPSAAPAAAKGWTSIAAALPAALTIAAAAPPSSKAKAKVWAPPIPGYHRGTWDGWSKSEPKMGSLTWEKKKVACWETRLQCERSGLKLGSPVDFTVHVKENGELAVAVLRLAQRMDSAVAPTATPSTPPDELAKQLHRGIWTGWQQGSKESIFGSIQYRKDGTGEILVISAHINGLKDPRECFEVGTIVRFVFRPEIGPYARDVRVLHADGTTSFDKACKKRFEDEEVPYTHDVDRRKGLFRGLFTRWLPHSYGELLARVNDDDDEVKLIKVHNPLGFRDGTLQEDFTPGCLVEFFFFPQVGKYAQKVMVVHEGEGAARLTAEARQKRATPNEPAAAPAPAAAIPAAAKPNFNFSAPAAAVSIPSASRTPAAAPSSVLPSAHAHPASEPPLSAAAVAERERQVNADRELAKLLAQQGTIARGKKAAPTAAAAKSSSPDGKAAEGDFTVVSRSKKEHAAPAASSAAGVSSSGVGSSIPRGRDELVGVFLEWVTHEHGKLEYLPVSSAASGSRAAAAPTKRASLLFHESRTCDETRYTPGTHLLFEIYVNKDGKEYAQRVRKTDEPLPVGLAKGRAAARK